MNIHENDHYISNVFYINTPIKGLNFIKNKKILEDIEIYNYKK